MKLNPNEFALAERDPRHPARHPERALDAARHAADHAFLPARAPQRRKEIKRRRNPDDGRSSLIELTKQGEKNVLAAMPALRESVARVSEHLDYSVEELDLALDRLEDALRAAVSRPDESVRPSVRRSRR